MTVKNAMILAAGRGERMLPLSQHLPKPLFQVAGTTLLGRHLERLSQAGIERVVINVHYLAEMLMNEIGASYCGIEVVYSQETQLLETAGGIRAALPLLGDSPFIVVNGDIYTDYCFSNLLHEPRLEKLPHLVMVPNPEHHPKGDFSLGEGGVLGQDSRDLLTYSGIGLYQARFFDNMSPGKTMLRPLFDHAVDQGQLYGEKFDGLWSDVGTPARYEALKAQVQ